MGKSYVVISRLLSGNNEIICVLAVIRQLDDGGHLLLSEADDRVEII